MISATLAISLRSGTPRPFASSAAPTWRVEFRISAGPVTSRDALGLEVPIIDSCPLCSGTTTDTVYSVERSVLQVVLPASRNVEEDDFNALTIVRCDGCGHLYNSSFAATDTQKMYGKTFITNTPVHVSMSDHLRQVVDWIGQEVIAHKKVIEIGAAGGHLSRIVAEKAAEVIIYEPCEGVAKEMLPEPNIRLFKEFFSWARIREQVDLIICRNVIEHVPFPREMLADMCSALLTGGFAYIEFPRAEYSYENLTVGDFHSAHVQYFFEDRFVEIAAEAGLVLARQCRMKENHDVGMLFKKSDVGVGAPSGGASDRYADFGNRLDSVLENGRRLISSLTGRLALYGANWQTQGLLAALSSDNRFSLAFDDNPIYQGAVIHGSGEPIPIVSPEPDSVLATDAVLIGPFLHDQVIAAKLRQMNFMGDIITPRFRFSDENRYSMTCLFAPLPS